METRPNAMQRLQAQALIDDVPLSVILELTNRCNERCVHCYVDLDDVRGELTTDEVLRILDELRAAGTLFLTLTGGEIFLRKDALPIARRARELGFALRLFSNGTLIDEEKARAIAEIGPLAVELSLFSLDPEKHDAVTRRPGSLDKTLRAARLLTERGATVVLKAPLMHGLADERRAVAAFARSIGASSKFDPTIVSRYDQDDAPLAFRLTPDDFRGLCRDPEMGLAVDPSGLTPPDDGGAVCSSARRVALISARGEVFPCSQRFPSAGSLRERTFAEIWATSPILLRLRNVTWGDLRTCAGCVNASFCGRCHLDAKLEDGDFFGPSRWAREMAEARKDAFGRGGATREESVARRFDGKDPVSELG